jgi:cold shock CspA family protein
MDPSPALEARIRELTSRFDRFSANIMRCHVIVEAPPKHSHQGGPFEIRIDLTVPGKEIAIRRSHAHDPSHEDAHVALRDAFRAARRELEDYERERQGPAKAHVGPPYGWIAELDPQRGFGRIETGDGRLLYFHRNSVQGVAFDALELGTEVRFHEEPGDQGPQASTVHLA